MATHDDAKNNIKIVSMADIEADDDIEYDTIPAFKEGEYFRIKSLTAGDMIEWSEANEGEAKRTAGLRLIIKSLVDEDGKRIANETHLALFRKKSHKRAEQIVRAILKLNGMTVKGTDDAKKD